MMRKEVALDCDITFCLGEKTFSRTAYDDFLVLEFRKKEKEKEFLNFKAFGCFFKNLIFLFFSYKISL